ncbi:MAG: hypothetical protein H0X37_12785 [Herpetosiphonaceae bacterium]|nr:hypothetical protein [Herpetosiphonaceae bacterium]
MSQSWGKATRPIGIVIIALLLLLKVLQQILVYLAPARFGYPTGIVQSAILGFRFDLWFAILTALLSLAAAIGLWRLYQWAWYLTMLIMVIGCGFSTVDQQWLLAIIQLAVVVYMMRSKITAVFGLGGF